MSRFLPLVAVGILVALVVAGCKRDDEGDAPSSVTPSATGDVPAETTAPGSSPAGGPTDAPQPTAVVTAAPTPIVTPGAAIGPLTLEGSIEAGGRERTYRLYVPSSVREGAPAALLIGLHGGFGSGEQFARSSGFDDEAEAGGFIAVYPDGTGAIKTWNGGACCGSSVRNNVDDVGFIAALIDKIASEYPVDTNRVYAVGHSNGGILALRLACELSDRVLAVGVVAGSLEVESCDPALPVSVLMIHGDADQNHPFEGGEGPGSVAGVAFNSVPATMETMRTVNGCSDETNVSVAGDVTTTVWACPPGVGVEMKVIAGGSHAWPGSDGFSLSGPVSQALNATSELWGFLADKGR
ncbi:MAG: alpha/beta hydrolase family esterase [Phycisphaerae bacterium]